MSTTQTAFRLPDELVARLDAYAAAQSAAIGIDVTRADVVRLLLTDALDAADTVNRRKRKKGNKR